MNVKLFPSDMENARRGVAIDGMYVSAVSLLILAADFGIAAIFDLHLFIATTVLGTIGLVLYVIARIMEWKK